MKFAILSSLFLFSALASARPFTGDMTCSEARGLVQANGAIVMNTAYHPQAGWLYDRFVANGSYCMHSEETQAAWVRTMDKSHCFIGYTCVQDSSGDD